MDTSGIPEIDLDGLPENASAVEQALYLLDGGHRIVPVEQGEDGAAPRARSTDPLIPSAWEGGTRSPERARSIFGGKSKFAVGFIGGSIKHQKIFMLEGRQVRLISDYNRESLKYPELSSVFKRYLLAGRQRPNAVREGIRDKIRKTTEAKKKTLERTEQLTAEIDEHKAAIDFFKEKKSGIRTAKAKGRIDGVFVDTESATIELAELEAQIKKNAPDAQAAADAIEILESKVEQFDSVISSLKGDLRGADEEWLSAYQVELSENLREELHNLQGTLARLLSIERAPHFKGFSRTWQLVEAVRVAIPDGSPFRPTWLDSPNPTRFPGFSAAAEALAVEMAAGASQ